MKRIIILIIIIISIAKVEALNVTLDSCIDGDTARFIVNNQSVKVRFLSINRRNLGFYNLVTFLSQYRK